MGPVLILCCCSNIVVDCFVNLYGSRSPSSPSPGYKRRHLGVSMLSSSANRCWSCLRSISLFPIGLSPFGNLCLRGYEALLRQFHSRLFPDCRLSYSLTSLELEKSVVRGQGEPEDGSGSHEKHFEGQCLLTEERRIDMAQGRGSNAKCCPLGSTLLRTNVEKQEGTRRNNAPQR